MHRETTTAADIIKKASEPLQALKDRLERLHAPFRHLESLRKATEFRLRGVTTLMERLDQPAKRLAAMTESITRPLFDLRARMENETAPLRKFMEHAESLGEKMKKDVERFQKIREEALGNFQFELPSPILPVLPDFDDVELEPSLAHYLCGEATFNALVEMVEEGQAKAPQDHDVLIYACGLLVKHVEYKEPHTLVLTGTNGNGHHTAAVAHFTQLVAHVVCVPQHGENRVITGFSRQPLNKVFPQTTDNT